MFAFDDLNPVKRFSALTMGSAEEASQIGWLLVCLLVWAVLLDLQNVFYYVVRIFFNSLLSIFLAKMDVIGVKNIPTNGPLILAANHSNQFIDGMCIFCSVPQRKVGILIAQKSYNNPVVGAFARAMDSVPIARPQDLAFSGLGALLKVQASPPPQEDAGTVAYRLVGNSECKFTSQLSRGAKITYTSKGTSWVWKVLSVEGDDAMIVALSSTPTAKDMTAEALQETLRADGAYKILPRGDHDRIFDGVFASLRRGGTVGIFPEGGSHDRTDLIDLKPGVALIALGAKTSPPVPIVPVGLSYFRGHLFRNAKVTVHFGPAILPTPEEQEGHAAGGEKRREACNSLLARVSRGMRDVIVPAASYDELQLVHVARRLWIGGREMGVELDPAVRQDLDRRFAFGFQLLLKRHPKVMSAMAAGEASANGSAGSAVGGAGTQDDAGNVASGDTDTGGDSARARELSRLMHRLRNYDRELKRLNLRDSQVTSLERAPIGATLFTLGHMVVMLLVALTPSLVLNAPVGLAAMAWARWRQTAALAKSDVKLRGFDVVLSEKLKFALVAVPLLWLSYAALLSYATPLSRQDVVTLLMFAPIASYIGVVSVESGMIALHDLRPMLARLMFDAKRVEALKREQKELRDCVHAEIRHLVESDETISKMYHTQGTLTTDDWERLRSPSKRSPKARNWEAGELKEGEGGKVRSRSAKRSLDEEEHV